jgi:uncharacterized membrane protein
MLRVLLKSGTLALLHMAVAFGVAYAVTNSMALAVGIALLEPCLFSAAYVIHERAWRAFSR